MRRPAAVIGLVMSAIVIPVVAPIALVVAGIIELVRRDSRFRRVRAVLLISGLVLVDFAGMVITATVWLFSPVGMGVNRPKIQERYGTVMTWWTNRLLAVISRTAPLPLDLSQLDPELLAGNAIVIGRHRSLLDAILPSVILGNQGRMVRYTLKDDLQYNINIDLVGQRMGHVFVNRSPKDLERQLEPIRELGRTIDEDSVGVIFPEGTFFNEKRKARAVAALRRRDPRHADIAETMQYLLPPRPAGTLALLEGAPDADIVVLGHVGFEKLGTLRSIFENLGANHSIVAKAWRFARADVPNEPSAQIDWLFDRWKELDVWVARNQPQL